MTAFDELVTSLVTGGMEPGAAAALVARAVIEATAKQKTAGAARTARWRERHKASQSVTGASPHSAVTVTSQPSQSVTCDAARAENAPLSVLSSSESERGLPKEESKEVVLSIEPRAKAKRGARLPDDWEPSDDDRQYAAGRGLRLVEIEIEATKFRNYWTNRTDKQAAKPRWDRAWQNWILNVRPAVKPQNNVIAAADDLVATMRQWERTDGPDMLEDLRSGESAPDVRLLPAHRGG